ncbi:MAG: hypothetical protein FJ294_03965 [Planctomycetes bacterium]|nr:hypothetical protein [Planctomycetota bacterium]
MTKWLKWCCGGCLVALVLAALAGVFVWRWVEDLPREWTSEAQIEISAPVSEVLPLVADLRRWKEWSAWNRDSHEDVERRFLGPEQGAGTRMEWESEESAGSGWLELRGVGASGVEYESLHFGALVLAGHEERSSARRSISVVLREFDHDYAVPGSISVEATERGSRVTWRESIDLGDSPVAKFFSIVTLESIARNAHRKLLETSLEGLKDRAELR